MKKELETNKDYAGIFGAPEGCKMIYVGDDNWKAVRPDGIEKIITSPDTTRKALEAINQPSVRMGM
jgi:hypothetical protein